MMLKQEVINLKCGVIMLQNFRTKIRKEKGNNLSLSNELGSLAPRIPILDSSVKMLNLGT